MYFLGIDSGGTKTAFAIIDKNGNVALEFERGTGHYMQIGFDGFENLYIEALSYICKELNIEKTDLSFTFMGLPGYGEVKEDGEKLEKIIAKVFSGMNYRIGNDVESGWAGSLACEPGINIVCGTGSIAVGFNEKNETARSGGWGEFIGDEASAYWVAKKGIEEFSKQADYRHDRTKFYDIFKERLELSYDFEIIDILHNRYKLARTDVAKISMIVSEIASLGDEPAVNIFKEAAHEIYLMIRSIVKQLDLYGIVKLSYTGGVFKAGDLVLKPLQEEIERNNLKVSITEPLLSPVLGSALLAYKLDGNVINNDIIENLRK